MSIFDIVIRVLMVIFTIWAFLYMLNGLVTEVVELYKLTFLEDEESPLEAREVSSE